MKKLLFIWLLFPLSSAFAYEIVEVYYREARDLLPDIQNMLGTGENVSVIDNKLIINASAARTQELTRLIRQLDQKTSMLLVEVDQSDRSQSQSGSIEAGGRIGIDTRRTRTSGRIDVEAGRNNQKNQSIQTLRVMSGSEASIELGRERQYYDGMYRTVIVGMSILPKLVGQTVKIDVYAENKGQRVATTVQGQLGQWITLGGINTDSQGSSTVWLGHSSSSRQKSSSVKIRISTTQ